MPIPGTFILSALATQAPAPDSSAAFVRFDIAADGAQSVVARVLGLPAGDYDVWRDKGATQVLAGTAQVGADGMASIALETSDELFDSFFSWFAFMDHVEIRQGETVFFSGELDHPRGKLVSDDPVYCVNGVRLVAVGDDLDARGQVVYRCIANRERVDVRLDRLAPGPYVVEIDDVPELLLDVESNGKARLRLRRPLEPGFGLITAYPLGDEIRVRDAEGEVVLAARMPWDPFLEWSRPPSRQKFHDVGDGAADGLRADFVQHGYVGYGGLERGWIEWQRDAAGAASITVRIIGQDFTPPQPYGVFVAGEPIGTVGEYGQWHDFNTTSTFAVGPDVDLRVQRVEVRDGEEVGLSLTFPRSVPAGVRAYRPEVRKPNRLRLDLLSLGTDLDATGRVVWRRSAGGAERLDLRVADLPAGSYDVLLDGKIVVEGALVVPEDGGEARATFSTTGKPATALPLDFSVAGALEIARDGTAYLRQDLGDP